MFDVDEECDECCAVLEILLFGLSCLWHTGLWSAEAPLPELDGLIGEIERSFCDGDFDRVSARAWVWNYI